MTGAYFHLDGRARRMSPYNMSDARLSGISGLLAKVSDDLALPLYLSAISHADYYDLITHNMSGILYSDYNAKITVTYCCD